MKIDASRAVLVLYRQGFSREKIAKELDIPIGTVSIISFITECFREGLSRKEIVKKLSISFEVFDNEIKYFFAPEFGLTDSENKIIEVSFEEKFSILIQPILKNKLIPTRISSRLMSADIKYIWQLAQIEDPTSLLKLRDFGKKSLKEIEQIVFDLGLKFGLIFNEEQLEKLENAIKKWLLINPCVSHRVFLFISFLANFFTKSIMNVSLYSPLSSWPIKIWLKRWWKVEPWEALVLERRFWR